MSNFLLIRIFALSMIIIAMGKLAAANWNDGNIQMRAIFGDDIDDKNYLDAINSEIYDKKFDYADDDYSMKLHWKISKDNDGKDKLKYTAIWSAEHESKKKNLGDIVISGNMVESHHLHLYLKWGEIMSHMRCSRENDGGKKNNEKGNMRGECTEKNGKLIAVDKYGYIEFRCMRNYQANASTDRLANPGAKKPDAGKPGAGKPGAEKPSAEKPSAEKPSAEKSGAEKPSAGKPNAEKPSAGKPNAGKPDAGKPNDKRPWSKCVVVEIRKGESAKPVVERRLHDRIN